MWAPVEKAVYTPANTARPHPRLMSSQPPPLPLVPGSRWLATTPQPSSVSIAVPSTSGRKMVEKSTLSSLSPGEPGDAALRRQGSADRLSHSGQRRHRHHVRRLLPGAFALRVVGGLLRGLLGRAALCVGLGLAASAFLVPSQDRGDDVGDLREG